MPRRKYSNYVPRESKGGYVAAYEKQSLHPHEVVVSKHAQESEERVLKELDRIRMKNDGVKFNHE